MTAERSPRRRSAAMGAVRLALLATSLAMPACSSSHAQASSKYGRLGYALVFPGDDPFLGPTPCEVGHIATCTLQCEQGNGACCNNVGVALERGENVAVDREDALAFYDRACALKNQAGCNNETRLRATEAPRE